MFKRSRIEQLEERADRNTVVHQEISKCITLLRSDIDAIAKHLGVKFEDINKRVLVKTDTPQSEP